MVSEIAKAAGGWARAGTLVAVVSCAMPSCAVAGEPADPWRDWTTLRLKAHGVPMFSGRFEMQRADGGKRLETQATARFLGVTVARSHTETVFGADGRTLRHVRSSKKRARRYVFRDEAYVAEKLRPTDRADTPVEDWQVVASQRFAYPTAEGGEPSWIWDYYGMLLRLRHEPLRKVGDEVTLLVATSSGPERFTIRVGEARRSERTFTDAATGARRTLAVDELRLRVAPADPERAEEGFLDMEGDTEIWVEAASKTPLEIEGHVPKAGRVRLELVELG